MGDGAALLRRRPDVQQAERSLAAATARIGVATANLFPAVTLGATTTAGGPTLAQPRPISATWPWASAPDQLVLPQPRRRGAQIQQAKAAASAALADLTTARSWPPCKETEQALTAYGGELDRHGALASARDHSDEALRLAKIQFDAGSASFLDLLVAQGAEANAQAALAQSDQALIADQITVFKALGGGWENAPKVEPAKAD